MCAVSDHTFNWGEKVYSILSVVVFFFKLLKICLYFVISIEISSLLG